MKVSRLAAMAALVVAFSVAGAGESRAAGLFRGGKGGGLIARLNRPLVPAQPGLPTVSPLGLISPRLSMLASIPKAGGVNTQAGRLALVGLASPRVSPMVAMVRTPPVTRQARSTYILSMISPRAATLVSMFRAASSGSLGIR
mgnify:CR=1 FL=1